MKRKRESRVLTGALSLALLVLCGCNLTSLGSILRVDNVTNGKVEWTGTDIKNPDGSVASTNWVPTITAADAKVALEQNSAPVTFNQVYYFDPTHYDLTNPHSNANLANAFGKDLFTGTIGFPNVGGPTDATVLSPITDVLLPPSDTDVTNSKPRDSNLKDTTTFNYIAQVWGKNDLGQKVYLDISFWFSVTYKKS